MLMSPPWWWPKPLAPPQTTARAVAISAGLSYRCRRCDVFGFAPADGPQTCWCCGSGDQIARR